MNLQVPTFNLPYANSKSTLYRNLKALGRDSGTSLEAPIPIPISLHFKYPLKGHLGAELLLLMM